MKWQIFAVVCVAAVLSAIILGFLYDCLEVQKSRYIDSWNRAFLLPPDKDEKLSKPEEDLKTKTVDKIHQNLVNHDKPYAGLTVDEIRLVCGYPPVTLVSRSGKTIGSVVLVYFDKNRHSISFLFDGSSPFVRIYPLPLSI